MTTTLNTITSAYEQTKTFINLHIKEDLRNDNNVFLKYFRMNLGIDDNKKTVKVTVPVQTERQKPLKTYVVKNVKKSHIWDMCKKLSISMCSRDYYTEYLYNIHANYQFKSRGQSKDLSVTKWEIQEVDFPKYINLLESVLQYDKSLEVMYKSYDKVNETKRSINSLKCVIEYKEVERQLKEYETELEDSKKRLEHHKKLEDEDYDNVKILKTHNKERHIKRIEVKTDYQVKLQTTLNELIRYCKETLEVKAFKMNANKDYQTLQETLESQQATYKIDLKKCINMRRKFFEFRVSPKCAVWKFYNHFGAVQWYKSRDIKVAKMYDKVTFDYKTMDLKIH